jgi:hypothetical protein
MKPLTGFLLIIGILTVSCQGTKKDKETVGDIVNVDELKGVVIDIHDEIMPKMGELMSLKKQLLEKMSSLEESESNKKTISQLQEAADNLENSHEAMMSWMREFDGDFDDMAQQEIVDYLEKEKTKIKQVGELTNASIAKAKELLGE